jgi:hypothetical protein
MTSQQNIYAVRILRFIDLDEENFQIEECYKKYFDKIVDQEQLEEHLNSIDIPKFKETFISTQILVDALPNKLINDNHDSLKIQVWIKYK